MAITTINEPRYGRAGFVMGFGFVWATVLANGFILGFNTLEDRLIYFNIAAAVFCILALIMIRKYRFTFTLIDLAFLVFIIYVNAQNFLYTGLFNNYLGGVSMSILVYFISRFILLQRSDKTFIVENLSFAFLLISFVELGITLYQFYNLVIRHDGHFELTGTFNNPGIFSIYAGSSFAYFLGIYLFSDKTVKKRRILKDLSGVYLLLAILVLPSAQSRTAIIMLVLVCLLLLNYRFKPLARLPRISRTFF